MKLWFLSQIEDRDMALFVHTTIVRAMSEEGARLIAQRNENFERDGEISWGKQGATCKVLSAEGDSDIILCA